MLGCLRFRNGRGRQVRPARTTELRIGASGGRVDKAQPFLEPVDRLVPRRNDALRSPSFTKPPQRCVGWCIVGPSRSVRICSIRFGTSCRPLRCSKLSSRRSFANAARFVRFRNACRGFRIERQGSPTEDCCSSGAANRLLSGGGGRGPDQEASTSSRSVHDTPRMRLTARSTGHPSPRHTAHPARAHSNEPPHTACPIVVPGLSGSIVGALLIRQATI